MGKRNKKSKGAGFTLIEFLIYTGIVVFVMTMLTLLSINVLNARVKILAMGDVNQGARFMMERIAYEIRNSQAIISATDSSLVLEKSLEIYNPTSITINEEKLILTKGGSFQGSLTAEKIKVTSINFTRLGEDGVEIKMTVEYYNPQERQEQSFIRTFQTTESVRLQ